MSTSTSTSHAKSKPNNILILGAGITALQTALHLQRAGYSTTIVAEHTPGDENGLYTSPWAGAQWRSHAGEDEREEQGWDVETYREWMGIVKRGEGGRSGLGIVPSINYWSSPTAPLPWWHSLVKDFHVLSASQCLPPTQSGVSFSTICINVPLHLQYLLASFHTAGGKLVKARLPTDAGFSEALKAAAALAKDAGFGEMCCFVNATGLGAKTLVPDAGMLPIKGQTVLVRGEAKSATTLVDGDRYVIPRPGSGTTILGGTREKGDWDTSVDDATTKAILEGCKLLAPELLGRDGKFEVLSVRCGLRPAREGGARVEREILEGGEKVVHSYGHAGAGYQNAVGCARKVVRLVKELEELEDQVSGKARL